MLTHCNTCTTCQKTSAVPQRSRAPLQPLPVISEPFRRIAMDIVGPLEKSSAGHRYIFVISDYATQYPKAFPLRTITTPKIVHSLVQLFSRVRIPEEILTDQGTNFTSRLMGQLNRQLGITAIRTSPYHPQTDGLVERFNQTPLRICCESLLQTRDEIETSGYLSFSLLTEKFLKLRLVSHHLSSSTGGKCKDRWTC